MSAYFDRRGKRGRNPGKRQGQPLEDMVQAHLDKKAAKAAGYRERSLRLHGLVCARCGREFDEKNRHMLTVHHKDGNHNNNPSDGSNWENLCLYCHEDLHSRGILADYLEDQ